MKINIIGAGMSGLLAANMLRRHDITVIEKQKQLPNNHHAVLRFRTPEIGNILGISFKKVNMIKTVASYTNNVVADSLSYSKKVTGIYLSDRSIIDGTTIAERYIAPKDLIQQMAKDVNISYDKNIIFSEGKLNNPMISTIPMPVLMGLLGYDKAHNIGFDYKPGVVFTGKVLDCDAYASVLFPGPEPFSRVTITGDQLIIEFPGTTEIPESVDMAKAYWQLGFSDAVILDADFKKQPYFKIVAISDAERKKFQRWATVNYNIYSLGRYATWRPKLLLDDLIDDVRKIEGWIMGEKQ
jgi:NAD(P)-binding Rossmann-like domain